MEIVKMKEDNFGFPSRMQGFLGQMYGTLPRRESVESCMVHCIVLQLHYGPLLSTRRLIPVQRVCNTVRSSKTVINDVWPFLTIDDIKRNVHCVGRSN